MPELAPTKVAYFIDALNVGGTELQLAATIDSMDRGRVTPYLFSLRRADDPIDPMPDCPHSHIGIGSFRSPSAWSEMVKVARWLRREKVDIVQTYFPDASLFGTLAAKLARGPLVVSCRRDMGHWLSPAEIRRIRFLNRLADRFLSNAECIKNSLVENYAVPEDRVTVLPNFIDASLFERTPENTRSRCRESLGLSADYVVGTVANLNRPIKRVDVFLRAAAEVARKKPSTDFVVIGDGDLKSELEALASGLGIRAKTHFLGSRSDVPRCIGAFDVGVNSSDSEGLCNAIIEYMAAGLPSVVTDTGGNGEIIGDDSRGTLVPTGDHGAMAAAIVAYLDDEGLRKDTGRKARERVDAVFDKRVVMEGLMEYYRSICSLRQ